MTTPNAEAAREIAEQTAFDIIAEVECCVHSLTTAQVVALRAAVVSSILSAEERGRLRGVEEAAGLAASYTIAPQHGRIIAASIKKVLATPAAGEGKTGGAG